MAGSKRANQEPVHLCEVCGQPAQLYVTPSYQTLERATGAIFSEEDLSAGHWFCEEHADDYCRVRLPHVDAYDTLVVPRWQITERFGDGIELLDVIDEGVRLDMTGVGEGEGMHVAFYGREEDGEQTVTHLVVTLPIADGKMPAILEP